VIVHNEGHFAVKLEHKIIAIVQNNEEWEQIWGDPLKDDLLDLIYKEIDKHYE